MKKSELKTGMLVKHRYECDLGIIMLNSEDGDDLIVYTNGQNILSDWEENLNMGSSGDNEWDIIEVWKAKGAHKLTSYLLKDRELIYKNSETVILTDEYSAVFNKEDKTITVGCQTIPFSKVIEVANKIQELAIIKKPARKSAKKR